MIQLDLMIRNDKGLHARASAKFVETVELFNAQCEISKDGVTVSGDSIMGLLMLAATKGTYIRIKVWGSQANLLMDSLRSLIHNNFEEAS